MLAQKRHEHPGEHVAAAAGREAGVSCMVYINIQTVGNDRPAALEQKDGVRPVREAHRLLRPVGCPGVAAQPQKTRRHAA